MNVRKFNKRTLMRGAASVAVANISGGWVHGFSGPNSFSLTPVVDGIIFQRSAGTAVGPARLAGTYTGGVPTGVEGQVRKVSDNSLVLDWTALNGATIGSGVWAGHLDGIAQGGPYYVKVRPTNAPSLVATGATGFYIGIWVLSTGQSNSLPTGVDGAGGITPISGTNMVGAAPGYTLYAGANIPAASGAKTLLNSIRTATGLPVGLCCGGKAGASLAQLLLGDPGDAWTINLLPAIQAAGGDFELVVFTQGEADTSFVYGTSVPGHGLPTQRALWIEQLNTYHTQLATLAGRSLSGVQFLLSVIGRVEGGQTFQDYGWAYERYTIQEAARRLFGSQVYLSHSNVDLALDPIDSPPIHYTTAGRIANGARFAQTINSLLGVATTPAYFSILGATAVDATTTTIQLQHKSGTDFTPTSPTDITGFTLSGDGGATVISPTTARRTNATTITLTHASLGLTRKVAYQYGTNPDITNCVFDNSTLAVPLLPTGEWIDAATASPDPLVYFLGGNSTGYTDGTAKIAQSGVLDFGLASANRLIIGCVHCWSGPNTVTSIVVAPDSGSPITATLLNPTGSDGSNLLMTWFTAVVPTGVKGTVTVTYANALSNRPAVYAWSADQTTLRSVTPLDLKQDWNLSGTAKSIALQTAQGGFVCVVGVQMAGGGTPLVITGDRAYWQTPVANPLTTTIAAHTMSTPFSAASSITLTTNTSGEIMIGAASFGP